VIEDTGRLMHLRTALLSARVVAALQRARMLEQTPMTDVSHVTQFQALRRVALKCLVAISAMRS